MSRWRLPLTNLLSLACGLGIGISVCAAEPSSARQLSQLIDNLASEDFSRRQQAAKALEAAGAEAIPLLAKAITSDDREVQSRVMRILLDHATSLQPERRQPARAALEELAKSPVTRAAAAARRTLGRIRDLTAGAAIAELTRLHATVGRIENSDLPKYNVQIPQTWTGGDDQLALLADLQEVPFLNMENAPVSDRGLIHLGKLNHLEKLYLGSTHVTGADFTSFTALQDLQFVSLRNLPIDDAKLARLPALPRLCQLGLDGTLVGDEGLKELSRYPTLNCLWLNDTKVTSAGLIHLQRLPHLRTLYLQGTRTAGKGLGDLRLIPKLDFLHLKGVRLDRNSLKEIGQIEQLETLNLEQTNIDDRQLADLAGLVRLRILWLSKTDLTDQAIDHLKLLRSLQEVYLQGTEVSADGANELIRALPNCHVLR